MVTATSGDTSVASTFHNIQHINMLFLYPKTIEYDRKSK